jgi:hypothetical protein
VFFGQTRKRAHLDHSAAVQVAVMAAHSLENMELLVTHLPSAETVSNFIPRTVQAAEWHVHPAF